MYHTNWLAPHPATEYDSMQTAKTEILMTPAEVSTVLKYELKYEH